MDPESNTDCVITGLSTTGLLRKTPDKAPKRLQSTRGGQQKPVTTADTVSRIFARGRSRSSSFGVSPVTPIYINSDEDEEDQDSENDCVLQYVSGKTRDVVDVDAVTHQEPGTVVEQEETSSDDSVTTTPCSGAESPPHSTPSSGVGKVNLPQWWTSCPNCGPDSTPRKYHLIDVEIGTDEWSRITLTVQQCGFVVSRLQRIQNQSLWQRLTYEIQLMKENRSIGFQINKTLLYHTSRAQKLVVCEEGLDPRLSQQGCFGRGIYFSDDPRKCDSYRIRTQEPRLMYACSVLLGDKKIYPRGKMDRSLVREPLKDNARVGEYNRYDAVVGNINGYNEYVVYNAYRVLPQYAIEYSLPEHLATTSGNLAPPPPPPQPFTYHQHMRPRSLPLHIGLQRAMSLQRAMGNCRRGFFHGPMPRGFGSPGCGYRMRCKSRGIPPQSASPALYNSNSRVLNPPPGIPNGAGPVLHPSFSPTSTHSTTTGYQGASIQTMLNPHAAQVAAAAAAAATLPQSTGVCIPATSSPQQGALNLNSALVPVPPTICTICQSANCNCGATLGSAFCKTCNRIPFCCICHVNPLLH